MIRCGFPKPSRIADSCANRAECVKVDNAWACCCDRADEMRGVLARSARCTARLGCCEGRLAILNEPGRRRAGPRWATQIDGKRTRRPRNKRRSGGSAFSTVYFYCLRRLGNRPKRTYRGCVRRDVVARCSHLRDGNTGAESGRSLVTSGLSTWKCTMTIMGRCR